MTKRVVVPAILLAGLLLRITLMLRAHGTLLDDAYITLRFGRNLFQGHGLVFNPGERALGAPALYATVLGALWKLADVLHALPRIGYVVTSFNVVLMAVAGTLLVGLLEPERAGEAAPAAPRAAAWLTPLLQPWLPLALFALYVPFVDNTTTGMETTLFVTLQLVSLRSLRAGRVALAAGVVGLAMLVRPEGVLWAGALLAVAWSQKRLARPAALAPLALIVAAWLAGSTLYYGSPVPLNILAKCGWLVGGDNGGAPTAAAQLWNVLQAFTLLPFGATAGPAAGGAFAPALAVLLGLLAAFGTGLVASARRREAQLAFGLFFVACVLFYVAGHGATWPSWYAIPPGLAFYVMVARGFGAWLGADRTRSAAPVRSAGGAGALALAAFATVLALSAFVVCDRLRAPYYRSMEESYGVTGRWLQAHSERGDSLLVWEVGYVGYLNDRYTQEVAGIVSPRIFRLRRQDPRLGEPAVLIARFRPRFVVLPSRRDDLQSGPFAEWLRGSYDLVVATPIYRTYQRRDAILATAPQSQP